MKFHCNFESLRKDIQAHVFQLALYRPFAIFNSPRVVLKKQVGRCSEKGNADHLLKALPYECPAAPLGSQGPPFAVAAQLHLSVARPSPEISGIKAVQKGSQTGQPTVEEPIPQCFVETGVDFEEGVDGVIFGRPRPFQFYYKT